MPERHQAQSCRFTFSRVAPTSAAISAWEIFSSMRTASPSQLPYSRARRSKARAVRDDSPSWVRSSNISVARVRRAQTTRMNRTATAGCRSRHASTSRRCSAKTALGLTAMASSARVLPSSSAPSPKQRPEPMKPNSTSLPCDDAELSLIRPHSTIIRSSAGSPLRNTTDPPPYAATRPCLIKASRSPSPSVPKRSLSAKPSRTCRSRSAAALRRAALPSSGLTWSCELIPRSTEPAGRNLAGSPNAGPRSHRSMLSIGLPPAAVAISRSAPNPESAAGTVGRFFEEGSGKTHTIYHFDRATRAAQIIRQLTRFRRSDRDAGLRTCPRREAAVPDQLQGWRADRHQLLDVAISRSDPSD